MNARGGGRARVRAAPVAAARPAAPGAAARPGGSVPAMLALSTVALLSLLLAACGIDDDAGPRALPVSTTTSTTTTEPTGNEQFIFHMVQAEKLVPVTREVPARTPEAVMESLLPPPSPGEGEGLSSAIPPSTELLGLEQTGGVVEIDLSEDFETVIGQVRSQAIGQIVLTLAILPEVDAVAFSIDGEPLRVQSFDPDRGEVEVVEDCDVVELLADPTADTTQLDQDALEILRIEREEMLDRCRP